MKKLIPFIILLVFSTGAYAAGGARIYSSIADMAAAPIAGGTCPAGTCTLIEDGDIGWVRDGTTILDYTFDYANTSAESSPYVIRIDDAQGTHNNGGGAWCDGTDGTGDPNLCDKTQSWTIDELHTPTALVVYNVTNGESCTITDNDADEVICTLSGAETWDDGDDYVIAGVYKLAAGTTHYPTSTPQWIMRDLEATDFDDNLYIQGNCEDIGSNDEDCAFYFYAQDSTGGAAAVHGALPRDGSTSAGYLDFMENSDNGDNWVRLIGPSSTATVTVTLPAATDTLVGKATTDTFTNKTINADGTGNSITNIENADIKAAAAIDATKIADGTVTSAEFQYINTLSSNAQTQITAKGAHAGRAWTGTHDFGGAVLEVPNTDADPAGVGQLRLDTAVSNYLNGALRFHDGTAIKQVVDMIAATAEGCTDDYVVAYDSTLDGFYCKEDASGSAPATADISDVSVTQTELAELETIDATTISAIQWGVLGALTGPTATRIYTFPDSAATILYSGGALGTPSGGTLTNATGLPISTGVSGLGLNVGTFLATPSSANLAAALTDGTGTGVNVFATSPTLVTPSLGTINSGVGTALTALNGENIQDDTIDDDSIDFTDVTLLDFGLAATHDTSSELDALYEAELDNSAGLLAALSDETGTGLAVFATSPTLTTPNIGAATGTSLAVTGAITGLTSRGADITTSTNHDTTECHNVVYVFTAVATVTLDAAADAGYGAVVCYRVRDAEVATIDVDASEKINLEGTALTAGYTIDSSGAAGEFVCLMATTDSDGSGTDGWETWGLKGTWADGGAS